MTKLWLVIRYEYFRHVMRKGFLVALLSIPAWIIASLFFGFLAVIISNDSSPIGLIDQSQSLDFGLNTFEKESFLADPKIVKQDTEQQAQIALQNQEIQAYFIVPAGFPTNRAVQLIYNKRPDENAIGAFTKFIRLNILKDIDTTTRNRFIEGINLSYETISEDRSLDESEWWKVLGPIISAVFLLAAVFTSGGYLMKSVVDEKENRTMEILTTSVAPIQIMAGKVIGLIGVGLTQIFIWGGCLILGLLVGTHFLPFMKSTPIDWKMIGTIFLVVTPTFVIISAIMASIGATVVESREGQQISGLITLPVLAPFMLIGPLINNTNGPLSLFLTFFPLTSAMTIMLRLAFSTIPQWQLWISVGILTLSAVGSLWLAGKLFRLGMLRYGKPLTLRDLLLELKGRRK